MSDWSSEVCSSDAAAPDALPALPEADPALAGVEHQEQVDNPYGLSALWAQGDVVARLVLIIMLIMSGATWYIMIMNLIEQQKVYSQGKEANAKFWSSKSVYDGVAALKSGTPFW